MTLENKILRRLHSQRWRNTGYEIVKYSPDGYDSHGSYQNEEWTSISDVGCVYPDGIFTFQDYLQVEDRYVNSVMEIMRISGAKYLTIVYLESSPQEIDDWYSQSTFRKENVQLYAFAKTLHQGKRIFITDIPLVVKLCLRECLYAILINLKQKLQIDFGYDYYMHIHTQADEKIIREIAYRNNLFVNPRCK